MNLKKKNIYIYIHLDQQMRQCIKKCISITIDGVEEENHKNHEMNFNESTKIETNRNGIRRYVVIITNNNNNNRNPSTKKTQ